MSNSAMVNYTLISPYKNSPRENSIKKITIHHMAGNLSVEECGRVFQSSEASANYGIDSNGRVGMYVEEKDRSWASYSSDNDNQAVTIEVANDGGAPNWHVSDKALQKTIELCVDICRRNGIKKLNYTGDKSGNLTRHNMFMATTCPGPYLQSKFPYIAEQVNKQLGAVAESTVPEKSSGTIKKGDLVSLSSDAVYYNGKAVPSWVKERKWVVKEVKGDRAVIDKSEDGNHSIVSPINVKYLSLGKAATSNSYTVKVLVDALNIRTGPGTDYETNGCIRDKGVYTIVGEATGKGASIWGKLKSGAGWISLDYVKKIK